MGHQQILSPGSGQAKNFTGRHCLYMNETVFTTENSLDTSWIPYFSIREWAMKNLLLNLKNKFLHGVTSTVEKTIDVCKIAN
jgi:hypothetical protein